MGKNREQLSARGRGLTKALNVFICVMLTILLASCSDSDSTKTTSTSPSPPPSGTESPPFLKAHYRVSHNSYSGNLDAGYRGSIPQQLDAGLRFVELDIHLQSASPPFFKIGHSHAGQYVDQTNGNPTSSYNAEDWFSIVRRWVEENQPTEPVILAFDWKTDFNENDEGDTSGIETLHGYFADSIYLFPKDFDAENTPVSQYAGRIMVVLSGNENARKYYSEKYCFSGCVSSNDTDSSLPEAHMFVEYQDGNDGLEKELFYARKFEDGGCEWAKNVEESGDPHFTRLWLLTSPCEGKVPNLPATNFPYFGWYARYTHDLKAIPDFGFGGVNWNSPDSPGKGSNPDVAVNNQGYVVEVHKSQSSNHLYYNAGYIDGGSITWMLEKDKVYDNDGITPSVALTDKNIVVEIHANDNGNLYYRCGKLDAGEGSGSSYAVTWGDSTHYDSGSHPWVAINENNVVVEVHEGSNDELWYNVGMFNEPQGEPPYISWQPHGDYRKYSKGVRPTVAIYDQLIFEAHNSSDILTWSSLWCLIGELNDSNTRISWNALGSTDQTTYPYYPYPIDEAGSRYPSVALNSKGALEAHKDGDGIWWRAGKPSNTVMAVGPTKRIQDQVGVPGASGTQISIDANETHSVLSFVSGENDIYYMVGNLE